MASSEPWIKLSCDFASCLDAVNRSATELFLTRALEDESLPGFLLFATYALAGEFGNWPSCGN